MTVSMNDLHTSLNETPESCVVWDLDKESGSLFGRIILWGPFVSDLCRIRFVNGPFFCLILACSSNAQ